MGTFGVRRYRSAHTNILHSTDTPMGVGQTDTLDRLLQYVMLEQYANIKISKEKDRPAKKASVQAL